MHLASLMATASLNLIVKCMYRRGITLGTHGTKLSSIQINDKIRFLETGLLCLNWKC